MTTLTQQIAADMVRESMAEGGGPVEAHGLTYLPGAGFFVGSIGDMQSGAQRVTIGQAYGVMYYKAPTATELTVIIDPADVDTASEQPGAASAPDATISVSLDATLTTDDPPDALIEAAHAEALAENAARDAKALEAAALATAATDPALPKPPRKRKAPRE